MSDDDPADVSQLLVVPRPAVAADGPAIAALDALADQYPWAQGQCNAAARGERNQQAWVLEQDADLVGFAVITRVLDELTILRIAVHPSYRRRGYAAQLLAQLFHCQSSPLLKRAFLEVRRSNTTAICFYENSGFEMDGIRKNYYPTSDGREDAVLMSRHW